MNPKLAAALLSKLPEGTALEAWNASETRLMPVRCLVLDKEDNVAFFGPFSGDQFLITNPNPDGFEVFETTDKSLATLEEKVAKLRRSVRTAWMMGVPNFREFYDKELYELFGITHLQDLYDDDKRPVPPKEL